MKRNSFFVILMASILGISSLPAFADAASDRADRVKIIQANYVSTLDDQHKSLLALKEQMKVEPSLLKQVNAVIADFDSNYSAIVNGLANVNQEIQPIEDLAKEEVEEFGNSIYELQQMVKNLKTITCVKGKTIKKIVALKPACPKGYTKKK